MYKILANTLFLGKEVIYLPTCHSTNEMMQELVSQTDKYEGVIVITDEQTKGKGQRGNIWESEPCKNLTFSILLKPKFLKVTEQFYLNIVISLAIYDYIRETGLSPHIKWPNDLLVGKKKICGILIENRISGSFLANSIVGIGLNVNQAKFSLSTATSMLKEKSIGLEIGDVLSGVVSRIEYYYLLLKKGERSFLMNLYTEHLYGFGNEVAMYAEKEFMAKVVEVTESGRLKVKTNNKQLIFDFKEVSFLLE